MKRLVDLGKSEVKSKGEERLQEDGGQWRGRGKQKREHYQCRGREEILQI
jgi:hypothetical protein